MAKRQKNMRAAEMLKGTGTRPLLIGKRTKDEHDHDALARVLTRPCITGAITAQYYSRVDGETLDLVGLVNTLERQAEAVNAGDLSHQEAMLASQAKTLDLIFNNLARRAVTNLNEGYLDAGDKYLRLSLKAQSQCRTTVEALAEIKNPRPVAFVKQANIAHGYQQVNNGAAHSDTEKPLARENDNPQNKLLESTSGEWLDTGTQSPAGRADKELATVGEIDGAQDPGGEGES